MHWLNSFTPDWKLIVAILALIFAVYAYLRNKASSRKALSYNFSSTELTRGGTGFAGLELVYEGRPIYAPSIVNVTIVNSGNVPIQRNDFEQPIKILFTGQIVDEELFAYHVSDREPKELPVSCTLLGTGRAVETGILVDPLLLNPGDKFVVAVLISEFSRELEVTARIVGVRSIQRQEQTLGKTPWRLLVLTASSAAAAAFGIISGISDQADHTIGATSSRLGTIAASAAIFTVLTGVGGQVLKYPRRRISR